MLKIFNKYYIEKEIEEELKKKNKKLKIYDKKILINWIIILGKLTKKGKKNISYYFLIEILYLLKKKKKILPFEELNEHLNKLKPNMLLYNIKKGTTIIHLPKFLTIKQSNKKGIEWWIKVSKKRKKKNIEMLLLELKNAKYNKSTIIKEKREIKISIKKNRPFFYLLK